MKAYRHLRKSAHQYLNLLSLMSGAGIKDLADDPAGVLQLVICAIVTRVVHDVVCGAAGGDGVGRVGVLVLVVMLVFVMLVWSSCL